eukprot:CAMPEP_0185544110 /NCGR_PEP_ID=MMETSP1381-20130426/3783_1 /TAXON_ID=298111 /ORGANISM="Pavlova sp., Strain CCMP459" /LENGTH=36 /DNA_ID= /DNA_START= /DNA_END= /DNA_ORIENTATION=
MKEAKERSMGMAKPCLKVQSNESMILRLTRMSTTKV